MVFVKGQHIDWIDGAKGVAIVAVVLLHCLPCLREMGWMWHIGQTVPVFLFITAYLISMRFESLRMYFQWERFAKMLKKVFVPFVVVLLIQLVCYALIGRLPSLKTVVKCGGIGPGSYYIWLYLQVMGNNTFYCYSCAKVIYMGLHAYNVSRIYYCRICLCAATRPTVHG